MDDKLMLKDYIGQNDINILVDIGIKGQLFENQSKQNVRLLKRVYTRKDKRGTWLLVEWESENRIMINDDSSCNDCGYSGLLIYELDGSENKLHPINNLYVNKYN